MKKINQPASYSFMSSASTNYFIANYGTLKCSLIMIVRHNNSSRTTTPQEDFIQKTSSPQNTNEQI